MEDRSREYQLLWDRVAGISARQDNLATGIGELRDDLRNLERTVRDMTHADEIAQAVAAAVRRDRRRQLTFWQKLAGAVAMLLLAIPSVETIAGWFG